MDIAGKTVIITGGAKGIGRCAAIQLLAAGANVCVFDIDSVAIEKLNKEHPEIFTVKTDITDPSNVKSSISAVFDKFRTVDVLVNNAGYIHSAPLISIGADGLKTYPVEKWERTIQTNLNAIFYVGLGIIERFVESRTAGLIINISSICASGNAGQSAYSASKAAVNALTVTWAKELGLMGIRVAGIAPGFTSTETTKSSISEATLSDWKRKTPLRRLGEPEEISDAIMFVIKNDFFNGRILEIDGGLRI
ncbi:MAG: hypothetical protein A2X64_06510 [Ignavibacteria bacterium GWF2_33_9]|nr:MAG: hypothetical protein A2X64_06510 [Ignavibacteria bacterium GWF2_33_9]